jgi:ATP-dependent helicase/nuclease subunit A
MEASRIDGLPLLPDENALRIMNVHKAKGLEAPVVILARHSTVKSGADRETVCIDRATQPAEGVMRILHTYPGGGSREIARAQGWDQAMDRERRHLDAERQRLHYVAATRAESALIVSMRTNTSTTQDTWDTLLPGVERDVPRFETLPTKAPSPEAADLPSPLEAERDMTERRTRAAAATYALQSPSRIGGTHVQETAFAEGTTGEGRAFGTAAHRLLEAAVRGDIGDGATRSAVIAGEEKLPAESALLLQEMLTGVRSHPFWKRICRARRRFPELPFGEIVEGALPTYMHGVIDLVFEEEDGWSIVDYKTDLVTVEDDPRIDGYRQQLAAYRDAWQRITGTSARAYLWFVRTGLLVECCR